MSFRDFLLQVVLDRPPQRFLEGRRVSVTSGVALGMLVERIALGAIRSPSRKFGFCGGEGNAFTLPETQGVGGLYYLWSHCPKARASW